MSVSFLLLADGVHFETIRRQRTSSTRKFLRSLRSFRLPLSAFTPFTSTPFSLSLFHFIFSVTRNSLMHRNPCKAHGCSSFRIRLTLALSILSYPPTGFSLPKTSSSLSMAASRLSPPSGRARGRERKKNRRNISQSLVPLTASLSSATSLLHYSSCSIYFISFYYFWRWQAPRQGTAMQAQPAQIKILFDSAARRLNIYSNKIARISLLFFPPPPDSTRFSRFFRRYFSHFASG